MSRRAPLGALLLLLVAPAVPAAAEGDTELRWSATLEAALRHIASREADDDVTGFFDRYEYTANKSADLPVELGLRDAALDLFAEGETPRFQLRLESPTSNLGVSGEDVDHPFLNQRVDLFGRLEGADLDLAYRRLRTERLRRFPDPGDSGLPFNDRTAAGDRFFRERTGFRSELRLRPDDLLDESPAALGWLAPQLALRGGAEFRDGRRQVRAILPGNQWLGLTRSEDQSVRRVGGGLLVAPGGLVTLAFDVDHERFREDARAPQDGELGAPFTPSTRTIGFVPDTDRTTGRMRLHSRFGERAVLAAGVQISHLQQVGDRTPRQRVSGLRDNELLYTSANVAADVALAGPLSASAFAKFDHRENDLKRDTTLFNAGGGSQVGPFLERWQRLLAGAELVYRLRAANLVAAGVRTEQIRRDLDFVDPSVTISIPPVNAQVSDESESYTAYVRTALRPLAALGLRGEIGYRDAPQTGYVLDLDDYVFGELHVSYTVPLDRPLLLTLFARGGSGSNDDFAWTGDLGERVEQDFARWDYRWGLTATTSPWEDVSLFASFFHGRNAQDADLVLSNIERFEGLVPLAFQAEGPLDYRADDFTVLVGGRKRLGERSDAGLSYTFTRALARYRTHGAPNGAALRDARRIDADIHRVSLEGGHRLRDGLRIVAGYRLDVFDDRSPVQGAAGSVRPFDLDTFQHTVTLGVTLTSALLE